MCGNNTRSGTGSADRHERILGRGNLSADGNGENLAALDFISAGGHQIKAELEIILHALGDGGRVDRQKGNRHH